MVTIYNLLEVDEKATKQEIEESYQKLVLTYHTDPSLSEQENKENEMILNKLKIAYDILMNDEKRKKYDNDLAKKRAEDLIKNVTVSSDTQKDETLNKENNIKQAESSKRYNVVKNEVISEDDEEENVTLSKEEQAKLRKAAQKEFQNNLKKAQKAEEEYNQAYNEAYNNYLRKMGYNVKEPWTLKRVKNVVITIIAIILVCIVAWMIPPVREILTNIYEENIIIKSVIDIFRMFINAVLSIFKK